MDVDDHRVIPELREVLRVAVGPIRGSAVHLARPAVGVLRGWLARAHAQRNKDSGGGVCRPKPHQSAAAAAARSGQGGRVVLPVKVAARLNDPREVRAVDRLQPGGNEQAGGCDREANLNRGGPGMA